MTIISNMEGKIWVALRNHLQTWTECPIAWPDEKFQPMADTPYLIVQPVGLEFDNEVITSHICGSEHRGVLNISTVVPFAWDYAQHVGLSSKVCDFFPDHSYYTYEDVTVRILDRPRVVLSPRIDGSGNRSEVTVNWRAWG